MIRFIRYILLPCLLAFANSGLKALVNDNTLTLENDQLRVRVDSRSGAISSFYVKALECEMIGEPALITNFRISLPVRDYLANYIDGMQQTPESVVKKGNSVVVKFSGMSSDRGVFPVDLSYTITLYPDYVGFTSRLTNHSDQPVAEFWFPRLGGWTQFGNHRDALLATPNYNQNSRHSVSLFRNYPGTRALGSEAAEWYQPYPGMVMPWWDLYDAKADLGLYLGYHDPQFRLSTWHTYLAPDVSGERDSWLSAARSGGKPVGLVFSHVRYPFIQNGESLESGEFIIRIHKGNWHEGSMFYRKWFLDHFPLDNSDSWLRKESSWFTSILYQPEDKVIANFETYLKWTQDARKSGIRCFELIGWNNGGLERNYPMYTPEEKLGGKAGFRDLLQTIEKEGGKCLVFNNYNILDQNTDWYRSELYKYQQQDQFGKQGIWMGWGESTLLARSSMSVRYHVRSSITPELEKILADQFLELVRDGADGFQIDKLCVAAALDFNPLSPMKPDLALCQGLVDAIGRLYDQCRALNPNFRMASEFGYDRLLPYFDVSYRCSSRNEISALRYVFPEWTSCNHISTPRDFMGVNGAVLTGAVIVVEPESYQGSLDQPVYQDLANYIKEINRIRGDLAPLIFTGKYYDDQGATLRELPGNSLNNLIFKVHGNTANTQKAIVVVNRAATPVEYTWTFTHSKVSKALLYSPFHAPVEVLSGQTVKIAGDGLHILAEMPRKPL